MSLYFVGIAPTDAGGREAARPNIRLTWREAKCKFLISASGQLNILVLEIVVII